MPVVACGATKYAKFYHIDIDPLNVTIGVSFFPADGRWRADSHTALSQLNQHISTTTGLQETLTEDNYKQRRISLLETQAD